MPRIEIIVPDSPEQPFSLPTTDGFSALIGREEDCDICIPIVSVSSRHAMLERVPGGLVLRDIGSTNGLVVDGVRVEEVMLAPSVQVVIGEATLVYTESFEERALFDSEKGGARSIPLGGSTVEGAVDDVALQPSSPMVHIEVKKPNYLPMVLYAILVFGLAIIAGMTYQHYKKTGNLLPLIWMGREPIPAKAPTAEEAPQ